MLPESAAATAVGLISPMIFTSTVPVVRTVMRLILIQMSFTNSQVFGLAMWKEALEVEGLRPSVPNQNKHEYQILCFEAIVALHDSHIRDLSTLQLEYARHVIMWGFECSKAEEEWDMRFIARRRLELAQLNRTTKKLAVAFEERLQGLLENEHLFESQMEQELLIGALERFREHFWDGVEVADRETAAALDEAEY